MDNEVLSINICINTKSNYPFDCQTDMLNLVIVTLEDEPIFLFSVHEQCFLQVSKELKNTRKRLNDLLGKAKKQARSLFYYILVILYFM